MIISENLRAKSLEITETELIVELDDGSLHSAPIALFPILEDGTVEERAEWEFVEDRRGIHWPLLDEDISIVSIVAPDHTLPMRPEAVAAYIRANRERRGRRSA
ncbi:MAG: DUF2442 domain-containing protein [Longimicrobiales bacterium]